jgi:cell wall-associated NlpC family hydrolase
MSRSDVLQSADQLSKYTWVCAESNRRAPCIRSAVYQSDWLPNQQVAGLPYNWGGADGPQEFDRKLRAGLAAGSHKRHGVSRCTAGIDCSGFVAWCWGHRTGGHDFSTATLEQLCTRVAGNVYKDLKPGDALNKPGSHVVLFAGYRPDGGPIVYEANGAAGRVIRNDRLAWSSLAGYYPVRSNRLVDP